MSLLNLTGGSIKNIPVVDCKPLLSCQSLTDSMEFLRMKKLRAAPVWDQKKGEFLGSCDMRTLLGTLLFNKEDCKALLIAETPSLHGSNVFKELVASKEAGPAGDIALNNAFRIIKSDAKLSEPLAVFGRGSCMIVGVESPGEFKPGHHSSIRLITQGRFLQYLCNMPRFAEFLDGFTNHSLAVASTTVLCVPQSSSTRDAFKRLAKEYVSCLAVVDEKGKLIDNLSITDSYDLFNNREGRKQRAEGETDESVHVYLRRVRGTKFIEDLVFPNGTSIKLIVETMLKRRILHAWIVNKEHEPQQCISATDIFKLVYMEYRKTARTRQMGLEDEEDIIPSGVYNLMSSINFTMMLRVGFFLYVIFKIRTFLKKAFP